MVSADSPGQILTVALHVHVDVIKNYQQYTHNISVHPFNLIVCVHVHIN